MKNLLADSGTLAVLLAIFVCNIKGNANRAVNPWLPKEATTEALGACATGNYSECILLEECGGLISLPDFVISASPFHVEYKPRDESQNGDHCMWTFDNSPDESLYIIKVRITLLSDDIVSSGGALSVVNWQLNRDDFYVPSNVELRFKNDTYVSPFQYERKLFLAYSSNNAQNSGFLVHVDLTPTSRFHTGSNYAYNSKTGLESFGPFSSRGVNVPTPHNVAIVINPQEGNTTFTLEHLNIVSHGICVSNDTLDITEISPKNGPTLLARLCRPNASFSYTSQYPILATFIQYNFADTTFQISWQ